MSEDEFSAIKEFKGEPDKLVHTDGIFFPNLSEADTMSLNLVRVENAIIGQETSRTAS